MGLQVVGQAARRLLQRLGAARREHQRLPRPRRQLGGFHLRRLLHHHVGVGAADAERADPGPARLLTACGRLPLREPRADVERRLFELQARVGPVEVQARRDLPVLQRERRLDQARRARRGVEVADVGLDRPQRAKTFLIGPRRKRLRQRRHLDHVAERRAGAVRLDVADRRRVHVAHRVRGRDHLGLAVDARRRVVELERAIVVGGEAADHRVDGVAVRQRVLQALEQHHGGAVAQHRALGVGVEGAADAVGRVDALLIEVTRARRRAHRDAARERHVALVAEQALAGEAHRHQRGRAGGLHVDARPLEVQLVGDLRREEILVIADAQLERPDAAHQLAVRHQVVDQVAADVRAREHADRAAVRPRIVAGVIERRPGQLQEQPVLRVERLGLARSEAEQAGVELVHRFRHAARPHIAGVAQQVGIDARVAQLLVGEERDRRHPLAQVAPVRLEVRRPRHADGHADDGDAAKIGGVLDFLLLIAHSDPFLTGRRWRIMAARAAPAVAPRPWASGVRAPPRAAALKAKRL
jgi:hypothetical protein